MSFLTLKEARLSTLKNIAHLDSGTDTRPAGQPFIDRLNEATRRLLRRGDWAGTVVPMNLVARKGIVCWPRMVGFVRKLKTNRHPVSLRNNWYDFPDHRHEINWSDGNPCACVAQGRRATYQDIFDTGGIIYAIPQFSADNGNKLTIFGTTSTGLPIQTDNLDGTFSDGFTLTMSTTSALGSYTPFLVGHITRALKDVTQGIVQLFAMDPTTGIYQDIAGYQGGETNPEYETSRLQDPHAGVDKAIPLVALIKVKYIPAVVDTDLVLIQNLDALKDYMQSLQYREAGDEAQAQASEASAIRELNHELRDTTPDDQIQISVDIGAAQFPNVY